MIEQGVEKLLREQRWGEAEAECRRLVAENPIHARLRALLGMALYRQGDLPHAVEEFERAVILDPNLWEVQLKLAQSLDKLQRYPEALDAARAGYRVEPNDPRLELLVEGLSRHVKERQDGWEQSVTPAYHFVEMAQD